MKTAKNEWLNELTIDDIKSEHLRAIAESCGLKDAISLLLNVPGIEIYVPKITTTVTEKDIAKNPSMKIVAEFCGYGVAARLIMHRAELITTVVYIPKDAFRIVKKRYILKNFNGSNITELALRCGVSDRYVQQIVSDMYAAERSKKTSSPAGDAQGKTRPRG
jgi:Mor family transcriptional regulator